MIQTITFRARSQLLYTMHCWPSVMTTEFWPYPIRLVVDIHNNTPLKNGLCPLELFAGVKRRANLQLMHPFGCPAYVLDSTLCNGGKTPKWDPRSERGVYLGLSPEHTSNVSLIFNIKTRHVSPQFHVVYDNDFTSITSGHTQPWPQLFKNLFQTNQSKSPEAFEEFSHVDNFDIPTSVSSTASPADATPASVAHTTPPEGAVISPEGVPPSLTTTPATTHSMHPPSPSPRREGGTDSTSLEQIPRTRNGRRVVQPKKYNDFAMLASGLLSRQIGNMELQSFNNSMGTFSLFRAKMDHLQAIDTNIDDMTSNYLDPRLYAASLADKDTLHYREAMDAEDKQDFKKAMMKEVEDLTKTHVWKIIKKSDLPPDARLIRLIWSFKRKRNSLGELLKHKARLCVHGGMQQKGIDYWHTYAPVVNWSTVKIVLTLTQLAGWCSCQIDYILAFLQAPIDTDIYCYLPTGFHIKDGDNSEFVLKLEKNLYGTKQAAANWYEMLKEGLNKEGFKTSKIDLCLFLRHDAIIVTYVDDCLIFSKNQKIIEDLIKSLKQTFKLTDEGPDVNAFLVIKVEKNSNNGTITMS